VVVFGRTKRSLFDEGDTNPFLYNTVDAFIRKKKSIGFSFPQSIRYSLVNQRDIRNPGPGYYTIRPEITRPSPTTFSISLSLNSSHSNVFKSPEQFDIQYSDPKSSLTHSNYQKFLKSDRFERKGRFTYNRIILRPSNVSAIKRNKLNVNLNKQEVRLKIIVNKSVKLRNKIKLSQDKKEQLINERIVQIKLNNEESDRRYLINKERINSYKLSRAWIMNATLNYWLELLASKYNLRITKRMRTDQLLRALFVTLLSIGRFRRKAKQLRLKRLLRLMTRFISFKMPIWRKEKANKMKEIVLNFLNNYSSVQSICYVMLGVVKRLKILQRWYRRYIVKKQIMLAAMNILWSYIEYTITVKKMLSKCKQNQWNYCIQETIIENNKSEVVPINVRIFYIKKHLNRSNMNLKKKVYYVMIGN